jgi:hypothetical protein
VLFDNDSLDGVTGGAGQVCLVDGTAPQVVDPVFPGAIDKIVNLGDYWDEEKLRTNRQEIMRLTALIGGCFKRAYLRLQETRLALEEWKSYNMEALDSVALNRNILALTDDFLQHGKSNGELPRHLFAAALTPEGIECKADSLLDSRMAFFAVKGSPGSGVKEFFRHVESALVLSNIYAEIFHNPFDPADIDMIILPNGKAIMVDISKYLVDYEGFLAGKKYRRFLDFDNFLNAELLAGSQKQIAAAQDRFSAGINDALAFINNAKVHHDQLENYYVPAMDFNGIDELRKKVVGELLLSLKD